MVAKVHFTISNVSFLGSTPMNLKADINFPLVNFNWNEYVSLLSAVAFVINV